MLDIKAIEKRYLEYATKDIEFLDNNPVIVITATRVGNIKLTKNEKNEYLFQLVNNQTQIATTKENAIKHLALQYL